jgi:ComF family protein
MLSPCCLLCGAVSRQPYSLCIACQKELPILHQKCPLCAQILPQHTPDQTLCGACLKSSPPFEQLHALFSYEPPITHWIVALKFNHQLAYAQLLGDLLAQQIRRVWYKNKPLPDLILPVPLHTKRLQERGFNQATEIARPIARALNIQIDQSGLVRHKATAAQSGLSKSERKRNIADSFIAKRSYTGLSVAVIDDVVTTGHTINECCGALRKQNVKRIDIWSCARVLSY